MSHWAVYCLPRQSGELDAVTDMGIAQFSRALERLEWKKKNTPHQATDETDKRASVSNVSSLSVHSENEIPDRWKLFHPDLDPDECEITHSKDGQFTAKRSKDN